jgi:parvulin-like peptidyl-prolyl isomerase
MKQLRIIFLLAALLVTVGAACGGDDDENVPGDAIAVVGDDEITKAEFDALISQARAGYKTQKRDFPKVGTPEYNNLKNQAVRYLVERAQFAQRAADLEVEVTDKQVDDRLAQIRKQYFGGSQERLDRALKQQGTTEAQVRKDIRAQLIQEAIFKDVTEDVKVSDEEIEKYYNENRSQYGQPESRDVRHILVSSREQANRLYARIKNGESFAKLAKQYSKDPGSKSQGGKLTIARGQTVPPFDQTAFLLGKGVLSRPIKTQYGYHLIQPVSAIKPAKTTPLKDVRDSIEQQLLQNKRNKAMTDWVEAMKKDLGENTSYQVGFAPPEPTTGTGTTSG